MRPRSLSHAVFSALAITLFAAAGFAPQAVRAQARLQFIDAGGLRDFVPSEDEVYLRWSAGAPAGVRGAVESRIAGATVLDSVGPHAVVKLSQRLDVARLRAGTDEFRGAFPGVEVLPVLYVAGETQGKASRRVLTRQLLVGIAAGQTPAQVGALVGAVAARESAEPGVAILDLANAFRMIEALAVLQKAGIPANPLLGHSWDTFALPKDFFFNAQWHLLNTGQDGSLFGIDANVLDAWPLTLGAGVTISIVDSCLQTGHPDLVQNTPSVNSGLHFDFLDEDTDPNPHFGDNHGTSVAGVAAARQNNGSIDPQTGLMLGVSGSAPDARLIGLRLINESGFVPVTDLEEATALFWKVGIDQVPIIDISNNSWGPGPFIGPDILTRTALRDATLLGRNRKGQITLFAAGNGQLRGREANLNGYCNSRYVIAVGAIDNLGKKSSYSELGANVLISAPSSGGTLGIVTTDDQDVAGYNPPRSVIQELPNTDYTNQFGGTSSATPLVAGVTGLLLAANPSLGWRDVKEILASTARQVDVADPGWDLNPALAGVQDNAAGFHFNPKFGGGMVDASAAVIRGLEWTNLAEEVQQEVKFPAPQLPRTIPDFVFTANPPTSARLDFAFAGPNFPNLRVEVLEVTVDITHARRSDLEISLVSPGGTTSILVAGGTPLGDNKDFKYSVFDGKGGVVKQAIGWTFTSVQHWGENSAGTWQLFVKDKATTFTGKVNSASVRLYGTPSTVQRFKFEAPRYSVIEPDNAPGAALRDLKVKVLRLGSSVGTAAVSFSTSPRGTATAAVEGVADPDYLPIAGTLLFGNGETFKEITVSVLNDDDPESTEPIYLLLKNPVGASFGGVNLTTIELIDNDENRVTVIASDSAAAEPSLGLPEDLGVFTISRTVPSAQPLVVRFSIAGTATPGLNPGDDYVPVELTATIPANETSTTVTIEARDDETIEGSETVILSLTTDSNYQLGVPASAQVRIIDNDRPSVQTTAIENGVLRENDQARIGTVRISRTDDTTLPLVVNLAYGGNQVNGGQYVDADAPALQPNKALPDTLVIPSGQSFVDLHIKTVNDAVYQASKAIVISLDQSLDYNFTFGFLSSANVTVIEDDALPDTRIPSVKVSLPKANTRFVAPSTVTVSGTAADNTKVQAVEYRVNSDTWKIVPGVTAGASVTWSLNLNVPTHPTAPEVTYGANVVELRSVDEDGNRSVTGVASFKYVLERAIQVSVLGQGGVTNGFLGTTTREVGTAYEITAQPLAGQVFLRWTGLVGGFPNPSDRKIRFKPEEIIGAALQAEFIPTPFVPAIIGNYSGLARRVPFTFDSSAYLTVNVTPTGVFTGKLSIKGVTYSLKGEFNGAGVYVGSVPRKGDLPITLNLSIDLAPAGTQRITGTVVLPTGTLNALLDRAPFSKTVPPPASVSGKQFTMLLPANTQSTNGDFEPDGDGYGTVSIDTAGQVKVIGTLPDGTKFTSTQSLTKNLTWPLFVELYSRKGIVIGTITHDALQPASDFRGSYSWFKPAKSSDKYFPLGFIIEQNDLLGSAYSFTSGRALAGFANTPDNAAITLDFGNLANIILKVATFNESNLITVNEAASASKGEGLTMKVSTRDGTFTGSFTHPLGGKKVSIQGVLFQKQQTAMGGFLGISIPGVPLQTGRVLLESAP